ncbi:MAG: hypothetical protein ACI3ZP_04735 [Candidatus Cryptobacteroides sp.]
MEKPKKIKAIVATTIILFLSTTISWGQYKQDSDYRTIQLQESAITYKRAGFWTMISSPVVVYLTSRLRQYTSRDVSYYKVNVYSDDTYSSILETLRFNSIDEALDYTSSSCPYYDSSLINETVYPCPKWVPWAAGGATLAIGGILYGIGVHKKFLIRKEKYKMELAYDMTYLSLKLGF